MAFLNRLMNDSFLRTISSLIMYCGILFFQLENVIATVIGTTGSIHICEQQYFFDPRQNKFVHCSVICNSNKSSIDNVRFCWRNCGEYFRRNCSMILENLSLSTADVMTTMSTMLLDSTVNGGSDIAMSVMLSLLFSIPVLLMAACVIIHCCCGKTSGKLSATLEKRGLPPSHQFDYEQCHDGRSTPSDNSPAVETSANSPSYVRDLVAVARGSGLIIQQATDSVTQFVVMPDALSSRLVSLHEHESGETNPLVSLHSFEPDPVSDQPHQLANNNGVNSLSVTRLDINGWDIES